MIPRKPGDIEVSFRVKVLANMAFWINPEEWNALDQDAQWRMIQENFDGTFSDEDITPHAICSTMADIYGIDKGYGIDIYNPEED